MSFRILMCRLLKLEDEDDNMYVPFTSVPKAGLGRHEISWLRDNEMRLLTTNNPLHTIS